jgi:FlaA1/EpsC-like NDP-sugar epimerase
VVRDKGTRNRRRLARLNVPLHIAADLAALIAVWFLCVWALRMPLSRAMLRVGLPLQVISTFVCLVLFGTYRTIWSRAMISNYMRLFFACAFGAATALLLVYYTPVHFHGHSKAMALAFATSSYVGVIVVRIARGVVRDFFYALDCSRLKARKDVSRVLVYGAGLRYRSFRRELVRTTSANNRMIVGLIDDDILLRGQYIGGLKVMGTLAQAPEIIKEVNADAVVVACVVSDSWMKVIRDMLGPTGVKITQFRFVEEPVEA